MKAIKFLFGLVSWATIWLLCAKKSWKTLRGELSWKTSEQKAKIIWEELLEIWREVTWIIKSLPENEHIKELTKLWKDKLTIMIEEAKNSECVKEYLPKIQAALKEVESWMREAWEEIKKKGKKVWEKLKQTWKAWKEIKKKITKAVSKIKSKVS